MKQLIFTVLSLALFYGSEAQYSKVNIQAADKLIKEESGITGTPITGTFIGFSNPPSIDETWQPALYKVADNENDNDELLMQIKEEKNKLKQNNHIQEAGARTTVTTSPPIVGNNFAGINNGGGYTPLDNTIAISNNDTIVAMANSTIAYYTTSGTLIYSHDIYTFIGDNAITNSLCDPKVIWDNVAKRFIFYVQVCDHTSANSLVILGFSKSSNPKDGWYHYKFTGNPLNNGCFFDYPKMAVSNDEVFVTGNLFLPTSPTTANYNTSIIYQVQKAPCFAGSTLTSANSKYYSTNNFTSLPVGYGQTGSYGPGIYLVSTGGTTHGSNSFKLMDITNNIASGTATLNTYNVSAATYSVAGNAAQLGSSLLLDVLDCRSMDGFYLKGTIHFVFSKDVGSGFTGTSYNRLAVSTLTDVNSSFSSQTGNTDITYPAIASPSNDSTDQSIILAFNESGAAIYPQTCVARCDQNMNWSAPVVVKAGLSYEDFTGGGTSYQRWGDYNGMAKKYGDATGTLWMAGMYGGAGNQWLQWIAKINPYATGVANVKQAETTARVYPNPVVDYYKVQFNVPERQKIIINITDMEGRTVVELYNNIVEQGENVFSFRKENLPNGVYSLNIISTTTNIKNEQIVVAGK